MVDTLVCSSASQFPPTGEATELVRVKLPSAPVVRSLIVCGFGGTPGIVLKTTLLGSVLKVPWTLVVFKTIVSKIGVMPVELEI